MPAREKYSARDWARLGQAVVYRRVELGYFTATAFAKVLDTSTRLLGDIEHGRRDSYGAPTLHKLERALCWERGSVALVLRGEDPVPKRSELAGGGSPTQLESERAAVRRVELSRESTEELVQGIQQRVGELRRRIESADQLLVALKSSEGQFEYAVVAEGHHDFEDEDMMREMEP